MTREQLHENALSEVKFDIAGTSLDSLTFIFGSKTPYVNEYASEFTMVEPSTPSIRCPPGGFYPEEPHKSIKFGVHDHIAQVDFNLHNWENKKRFCLNAVTFIDQKGVIFGVIGGDKP
jgi:hypothetical protein